MRQSSRAHRPAAKKAVWRRGEWGRMEHKGGTASLTRWGGGRLSTGVTFGLALTGYLGALEVESGGRISRQWDGICKGMEEGVG